MYKITMFNAEYGQLLNKNGDLYINGQDKFCPSFSCLEGALKEKDQLLSSYIYAGLTITNIDTNEVFGEYYNDELGKKFSEEKRKYLDWACLPFYKRIFSQKPISKYYDGKH